MIEKPSTKQKHTFIVALDAQAIGSVLCPSSPADRALALEYGILGALLGFSEKDAVFKDAQRGVIFKVEKELEA